MALPFKNSRSLAKIAAVIIGAAAAAAALARSAAVPSSVTALSSSVPRLWSSVRFFLVPPYLFITVHLIIVAIWKLSDQKTHRNPNDKPADVIKPLDRNVTPLKTASAEIPAEQEAGTPISASKSGDSCVTEDEDEDSVVSSRFVLPQAKEDEYEEEEEEERFDLEDTWQAIVIKKTDTWERSSEQAAVAVEAAVERTVKRSVSFREPPATAATVDGNDELNRRFEAFIKKNYDQIRSY